MKKYARYLIKINDGGKWFYYSHVSEPPVAPWGEDPRVAVQFISKKSALALLEERMLDGRWKGVFVIEKVYWVDTKYIT